MTSAGFAIEAGHGPHPTVPAPSYNIQSPSQALSPSGSAAGSSSSINILSISINNSSNNNSSNCLPNPTPDAEIGTTTPNANPSASASTGTTGTTTATASSTPSLGHQNNIFHAHRQNHNSSKLPAFRFADLKKDAFILPSLLQHMPPSPVSPNPAQNTTTTTPDNQESPPDANDLHLSNQHQHQHQDHPANRNNNGRTITDNPASFETPSSTTQISHHTKSQILRASTISAPSPTTLSNPSTGTKRPASFPDSPRIIRTSSTVASQSASIATQAAKRRLTTSGPADTAETSTSTDPALKTSRAPETSDPTENSTKEWAQGQRQLLLPKTLDSAKPDEKKRSRPPVSYRAPNVTPAAGAARPVIPPIRSFRSSGSRKSLVLDMQTRRMSDDSFTEDNITDPNQRDRTLRALEGREDDYARVTPPDSADATTDNENTAEIFMNIAREESAHRQMEDRGGREDQSAISRITRASHRRPLSTNLASFQATSPPQLTRRLSDQRENFRARNQADIQAAQKISRELSYNRPSITTSEEPTRSQSLRTPLRPPPVTPRHSTFQEDNNDGNPLFVRRRSSVAESSVTNSAPRVSQYRNANLAVGQGRTYNSSPLVPKSVEVPKHEAQHGNDNHGVEGTESSGSTAAPSTVWDELDDLKSRIHRLELTGKIPPTSGAAMSRASDDRPPTATTNATTMSASPKQRSGTGAAPVDATSTASSQRDSQPLLLSALSKTKSLVSHEVFSAIESAATDALALSNMMGTPGQPGPISSGASTVGVGGSITDRQLRRKADSICRSLTELCIALADEVGQPKQVQLSQPQQPAREAELLKSPTTKPITSSSQKRSVAFGDSASMATAKLLTTTSPRAPTSLEQRRMTMLATSNISSPRYATGPLTPLESTSAGRKSSMLLRTFRAGTEEPEEATGRRSSLILRKRRAVTEEPEEQTPQEGRKTSLLRTRRTMNETDDDAGRLRTPSRAVTEVNAFRASTRDVSALGQSSPPDASLGSSPLPRSRLIPTSFNARLAGASTSSSTGLMQRRFLGRTAAVADREGGNGAGEKVAEERVQRHLSLSQTALLNRTSSLTTPRRRESAIPSLPTPTQQGSSGSVYR